MLLGIADKAAASCWLASSPRQNFETESAVFSNTQAIGAASFRNVYASAKPERSQRVQDQANLNLHIPYLQLVGIFAMISKVLGVVACTSPFVRLANEESSISQTLEPAA